MSDEPILAAIAALRTDMTLRMDQLETGHAAFRADLLAELGQTRVAIMERMDRLENSLTDIRNDIGVNFAASDVVKRANDNTREEMRALGEVVSGLVRKVRTLETRVREITGDP
jgi:uncharacterized coiled-coil DUF342 family protein